MSGLAVAIGWSSGLDGFFGTASMLNAVPYRTNGGVDRITAPNAELAVGNVPGANTGSIHADPGRRLWVACEARFDDRRDLVRRLGIEDRAQNDAELVALGFERWGESLPLHLLGDFAFVVWDGRRAFAARDAFGPRPLFYHATSARIAFATEQSQLLALGDVSRAISDETVRAYLVRSWDTGSRTFFRDIHRLSPGHVLSAEGATVSTRRFFHAPERDLSLDARACDEEFRRRFFSSVEARLKSDRPLLIELSGGLDSSSIACAADAIYRAGDRRRPPVHLVSAVFPGLATDESPFIDAVARRVGFSSERFDATLPADFEWENGLPHPDRSHQLPIASGWRRIAVRRGARVVLSGMGGDELLFERGVFRDLARRGRIFSLVREARSAPWYSSQTASYWLKDGLRALAPRLLRDANRRLRSLRTTRPLWMEEALWRLDAEAGDGCDRAPSETQRFTFLWLTHPRLTWNIEVEELAAARAGLEVRYPFLDAGLARFVLELPYSLRIPGGRMKILLRRALAGILPEEIAERRGVTSFDAFFDRYLLERRRWIAEVLEQGPWMSAPYVKRTIAQGAFAKGALRDAWHIALLERWLRASL